MRRGLLRAAALAAAVFVPFATSAADTTESLWAAAFLQSGINDRLQAVGDLQFRSSDDVRELRNTLLRGGLGLTLQPGLSVVAGYAYIATRTDAGLMLDEHRVWQQISLQHAAGGQPLNHRLRLEQRFIEQASGPDLKSDRLRYFLRQTRETRPDHRGLFGSKYLALQNEVFVHLSNRERLNGRSFDQNRAYVGLGWRWTENTAVELGYLNQYLGGRSTDTVNHVLQLSVHTRR